MEELYWQNIMREEETMKNSIIKKAFAVTLSAAMALSASTMAEPADVFE